MKLCSIFQIFISYILTSVMLGTFQSCRDTSEVSDVLDRADSLVCDYPDFVLAMLDSISEEIPGSPKSLRMRYELLHADAQNKAYVDFTTDSLMKEVVGYYDSHGTPNQKMMAHYLLGCTYRDMGESPLALESYQNAVDCADTASSNCDFYNLASIYGQMGELFADQGLAENAIEAYKSFGYVSLKANDSLNAVLSYYYRSRVIQNYLSNMDDSVYCLSMKVREWLLSHNYRSLAAEHVGTLICYEIDHGNYTKAQNYLNEYERYSNLVDSSGSVPSFASIYYNMKGLVFLHSEKFDSAKIYFQKLYNSNLKEPAYNGLLKLYTKIHKPDSIVKYARLYASANDSSFLDKNSENLVRISSMYRYGRIQKISKENADLYARSQTHKFYLVCVILFLFVSILFIYVLYKRRQKKNIERIKQLAYQLETHKDKLNIILEEVEKRNVSIIKKNNEIIDLQEKIHDMETILNSTSKDMITQSFFNTDIYGVIKSKSRYSSVWQPVTNDEWQMLISKFRIYYSEYSSFLLSGQGLTDDQYKVCMLIALNFRESEMALLMDTDKMRINRLKIQSNEKLFGKQDAKSLRINLFKHY